MPLNPLGEKFFPGIRKLVNLDNYVPLRSRGDANGNGGTSQKKLMFSMEIGNDNVVGMPGWVGDAIDAIAKDEHLISRIIFDNSRMVMPGMTIEVFASMDSKRRALLLTACEFSRFTMERQGLQEATRFFLSWQVRCPDPLELHEWLHDHFHRSFCIAIEQGQKVMNFDTGEQRDAEDDEDEDETEDVAQGKLGYEGENAKTMDKARDEEFHGKNGKSAPSTTTDKSNGSGNKDRRADKLTPARRS